MGFSLAAALSLRQVASPLCLLVPLVCSWPPHEMMSPARRTRTTTMKMPQWLPFLLPARGAPDDATPPRSSALVQASFYSRGPTVNSSAVEKRTINPRGSPPPPPVLQKVVEACWSTSTCQQGPF